VAGRGRRRCRRLCVEFCDVFGFYLAPLTEAGSSGALRPGEVENRGCPED
jgi:hypothetical protein